MSPNAYYSHDLSSFQAIHWNDLLPVEGKKWTFKERERQKTWATIIKLVQNTKLSLMANCDSNWRCFLLFWMKCGQGKKFVVFLSFSFIVCVQYALCMYVLRLCIGVLARACVNTHHKHGTYSNTTNIQTSYNGCFFKGNI